MQYFFLLIQSKKYCILQYWKSMEEECTFTNKYDIKRICRAVCKHKHAPTLLD